MDKSLILKIGKIWNSSEGSMQKIDLNLDLDKDFYELEFSGKFVGLLTLIKIQEEIAVIIGNAEVKLSFSCAKCLKKFKKTIKIDSAERQYRSEMPDYKIDDTDVLLINMKDLTIDISDFIREEIILHFPLIPVCSSSCKGLCSQCGKDLNREKCKCEPINIFEHKPFANLKKLFK